MRRFVVGWVAVAVAHELLGWWVLGHPVTALGGMTGLTAALTVVALPGFWLARLALIFVLPGVVLARAIRALRR